MPATPLTTVALHFGEGADHNRPSAKKIAGSLSAVVQHGRCLWLASDQTSSIERLTAEDQHRPDTYMDHSSFRLVVMAPGGATSDG
jgi:hypothetical protein